MGIETKVTLLLTCDSGCTGESCLTHWDRWENSPLLCDLKNYPPDGKGQAQDMIKRARRDGWKIDLRKRRVVCPNCDQFRI